MALFKGSRRNHENLWQKVTFPVPQEKSKKVAGFSETLYVESGKNVDILHVFFQTRQNTSFFDGFDGFSCSKADFSALSAGTRQGPGQGLP